MQPKATRKAKCELQDHQPESSQPPMRYGWSKFAVAPALDLAHAGERPVLACDESVGASGPASRSTDFGLPKDKRITIAVIGGPSKGLTLQFSKARISIGNTGGGADFKINDPQVSGLHCAVGVRQERLTLCDLDSTGGTYVEGERIEVADLEHLSEFRIGSSLLLITVLAGGD